MSLPPIHVLMSLKDKQEEEFSLKFVIVLGFLLIQLSSADANVCVWLEKLISGIGVIGLSISNPRRACFPFAIIGVDWMSSDIPISGWCSKVGCDTFK